MSLTLGTGPFGSRPGGVFNADVPRERVLYFEDSPRRIRGKLAGETVVESRRAKLLHETGHLPVYYFPEADVSSDLLEPTDHSTHCPLKGDASYWTIRVGERTSENSAWAYRDPIAAARFLAGFVAFYWHALDEWWEEDEQVFVHPRDPYHRVDALASSRHVRVLLGGELLAESRRPVIVFETGLPPRYYLPPDDVHAQLIPIENRSRCPYKGIASYWSVEATGTLERALVWTYPQPLEAIEAIAGLLCFFNERVDLELDGELQERPRTPFSSSDWIDRQGPSVLAAMGS
jgi:uncharacterized protein (DUF427 family)